MSYGKLCDQKDCKQYAKHTIHIMMRSRPIIPAELSQAIGHYCDDHKRQEFNSFVPSQLWDLIILEFRAKNKVPPVRSISYLVIKPYVQEKQPNIFG